MPEQIIIGSEEYPFWWLDELVFIKLNPLVSDVVLGDQPEELLERFRGELWDIFTILKGRTLSIMTPSDVRVLVEHYLDAGEALAVQARLNFAYYKEDSEVLEIAESLVKALTEFDEWIRIRYVKFLNNKKGKLKVLTMEKEVPFKILCKLSVDQIAIILRACDDNKVIVAKSLSIIFRSVAPYLSTDKMHDVSWPAMRKSSYQFERSDVEVVIVLLEKLIATIKEYY